MHFSPGFGSPEHAAHYACKYLNKLPKQGYPEWVLNFRGQIKRFSSSRGLLAKPGAQRAEPSQVEQCSPHEDTCFCELCRNGLVPHDGESHKPPREQRTVAQRLANCGMKSFILEVTEVVDEQGEVFESRRFLGVVDQPFVDVLALLDCHEMRSRWVGVRRSEFRFEGDSIEITPRMRSTTLAIRAAA